MWKYLRFVVFGLIGFLGYLLFNYFVFKEWQIIQSLIATAVFALFTYIMSKRKK